MGVQVEKSLQYVEEALINLGIKHVAFREPDIDNELTAIAIVPCEEAKSFCKHFKLALSSPVAQLAERPALNREVVGAEPTRRANAGVAQWQSGDL